MSLQWRRTRVLVVQVGGQVSLSNGIRKLKQSTVLPKIQMQPSPYCQFLESFAMHGDIHDHTELFLLLDAISKVNIVSYFRCVPIHVIMYNGVFENQTVTISK